MEYGYELYYVAKDSSGNEAKEKFFVDVHKKEVVVSRDNYVEPDHNFTTSNGAVIVFAIEPDIPPERKSIIIVFKLFDFNIF